MSGSDRRITFSCTGVAELVRYNMRYNYVNKFNSYLSVIVVNFFSYIPFLYVFPIINTDKYLIFLFLIFLVPILNLFGFIGELVRGRIKYYKYKVTALSLFLLFVTYVLASYSIIGDKLDDLFTIRTLVLINPIFVILALLCLYNKNDVIKMVFLLSGTYFIFFIVSFTMGNISLSSEDFQNIFMGMDSLHGAYQNINMYLGMFVICNIGLLSSDKKYISMISKILILLSIMGMLLVGGRSSIVALMVIFFIYFYKDVMAFSFKISSLFKAMILISVLVSLSIFYFTDITKILDSMVTWQRITSLGEKGDSSLRNFLFSKALELFTSDAKTLVFGAGVNSFPVYIGEKTIEWYPHNIILELLAEYGIIGTIFFVIPVIYTMSIRKITLGSIYGNSIDEKIIFLLFVYFLIIELFTGNLRSSWVFIFYLFLLLPEPKIGTVCLQKNLLRGF